MLGFGLSGCAAEMRLSWRLKRHQSGVWGHSSDAVPAWGDCRDCAHAPWGHLAVPGPSDLPLWQRLCGFLCRTWQQELCWSWGGLCPAAFVHLLTMIQRGTCQRPPFHPTSLASSNHPVEKLLNKQLRANRAWQWLWGWARRWLTEQGSADLAVEHREGI